ncbi:MAG: aminotransferase class III-fold pyridoxal phosphate-dependent enzyme, partial [Clostridia bacterium]|nr:aminotransferase class III-fold pyridoxal phosphate-dependent enzyme [Clostridia bacterium]
TDIKACFSENLVDKGRGGGLPNGARLLCEKVQSIFSYGDHGSTFGGNPVSCAAALSIINRIDDALLASVKEKSAYIRSELEGAKGIKCITGIGLMVGILPEKSSKDVVSYCMEHGVLVLTAKDKVRLLPALNIPFDVLKKAVAVIKDACAN